MHLRTLRALLLALLAFAALGVTACGGDDEESASTPAQTSEEAAGPKIKVGLVTDIGGLNDRSFNALANAGLERAKAELGVETRVLISKSNADYVPNLTTLAQQKYDLIIPVGFLMAEATNTVASKFPDVDFAIVDFSVEGLKDKPKNVQGLLFKEQEAGYLAGYLAGLYAKDNDIDTISSVGGQKIPPVDKYIAGYQAGAKAANSGIKTLNGYSQDFVDQGKCKELALSQIERGSKVVFQVAGQCGLGALDAAKQEQAQGIGVDADQSFLGDHILTSAMKKIDVAVFEAVKSVQDGAFAGGSDKLFEVKNEGVDIGKTNAEGSKYADQVEEVKQQLAAGEIDVPEEVK
ncbi:MAG: BMP family protein [Acidimicrobiia bacterium]